MRLQKLQYAFLGFLFGATLFIGFSAMADDGSWNIGNQFLIFKQQGASSDVFVGIGTDTPASKLEVNGKIQSDSTQAADSGNTVTTKDYVDNEIDGVAGGNWTETNGDVYRPNGNVGIGNNDPQTNLDVTGTAKISDTLTIGANNDTQITTTNALGNGEAGTLVQSSTGKGIKINSEDGDAFSGILVGANGQVGIGTNILGYALSVGGTLDFNNIKWDTSENINLAGTGEYSFDFSEGTGASRLNVWAPNTGELFTIRSNGRVGIGTTDPVSLFQVGDGQIGTNNPVMTVIADNINDGGTALRVQGGGGPSFAAHTADGSEVFVVGGNGNIGVGITDPKTPLHITPGGSDALGTRISSFSANSSIDTLLPGSSFGSLFEGGYQGHTVFGIRGNDGQDSFSIVSGGGNYNADGVYDTSVLYAKANGNVGIGTSYPITKLDVNGTVRIDQGGLYDVWIQGGATTAGGNARNLAILGEKSSDQLRINFNGEYTGGTKFDGNVGIGATPSTYKLHVNGTAYATGAAGSLSDKRHKKDIVTLENGLKTVEKLRPVSYQWKEENIEDDGMKGTQLGFIAQEVEEILPSVVLTEKNEENTKSLKYTEIIPVLTKAVQELKAENDDLKAQNIEILERLEKLENQ